MAVIETNRSLFMKKILCLLFALPLASCAAQPSAVSTPTHQPDAAATLIATSPSFEIRFDGATCTVDGHNEIMPGEHLIKLHNDSGNRSYVIVGRLYPQKHWQDFLTWFDEFCGKPGSKCKGSEAPWVSWLFEKKSVDVDSTERNFLYDLEIDAEYFMVVSSSEENIWPCRGFFVNSSPSPE